MERGLYNISSATTTTLIEKDINRGALKLIRIANCNASNEVTIRLFLDDDTNQTSFVENLVIPSGVTVELDNISFDNSVLSLKLQTAGTSPDVNVILK
jgi:hypothetical protein|tara:strand:- start:342 stop:635 length:294 start_codon:yes stop_codon:yes gene_type:complete